MLMELLQGRGQKINMQIDLQWKWTSGMRLLEVHTFLVLIDSFLWMSVVLFGEVIPAGITTTKRDTDIHRVNQGWGVVFLCCALDQILKRVGHVNPCNPKAAFRKFWRCRLMTVYTCRRWTIHGYDNSRLVPHLLGTTRHPANLALVPSGATLIWHYCHQAPP